jgi:hypothetical protein
MENRENCNKNQLSKDLNINSNQQILEKKFKKLKHKALYIDAEYEDVREVFSIAQSQFISNMFRYCSERKIHPPLEDKNENKKENKKQDNVDSDEIKNLYREIVKSTHPDKTKDLSENEIEERKELYYEAVKGKKEGDFWGIFKAAIELDVTLENLSFTYMQELEQAISDLENKIKKIEDDLMYKWYYCNEENQNSIFEQITKNQEKYE